MPHFIVFRPVNLSYELVHLLLEYLYGISVSGLGFFIYCYAKFPERPHVI